MKVVGNLDGRVTTIIEGSNQGLEDCGDESRLATMLGG